MWRIIIAVLAAPLSYIMTKLLVERIRRLGFTGVDVFKVSKPEIPSLGGVPILITYILGLAALYLTASIPTGVFASITLVSIISAFIGLLDDMYDLPGMFKPSACLLAGLPVIIFGTYIPRLYFPFGVAFRITYIYLLLILVGISVSANTVNMFDVINGSALSGTVLSTIVIIVSAYLIGEDFTSLLPTILFLAVLIGFLPFNIYPSKIFLGNIGSLLLGSQLALFGILYKVEFQAVVAMLPFIHNSFFFLNKVKGFIEHKRLRYKVTYLDEDGLIGDARDANAPITLIRLLVAPNKMSEKDLLFNVTILFLVSSALALLSTLWW